MTKHCMFNFKVYATPESFTQPLVAMIVTFCMSGVKCVLCKARSVYCETFSYVVFMVYSMYCTRCVLGIIIHGLQIEFYIKI